MDVCERKLSWICASVEEVPAIYKQIWLEEILMHSNEMIWHMENRGAMWETLCQCCIVRTVIGNKMAAKGRVDIFLDSGGTKHWCTISEWKDTMVSHSNHNRKNKIKDTSWQQWLKNVIWLTFDAWLHCSSKYLSVITKFLKYNWEWALQENQSMPGDMCDCMCALPQNVKNP